MAGLATPLATSPPCAPACAPAAAAPAAAPETAGPPMVEARPSGVPGAGMGLWAARALAVGQDVCEYTGRELTLAQTRALRERTYLKAVTLNHHIDGATGGLARFINDHFDASRHNVKFERRGKRMWVVAARDVAADEELFIDYGRGHWLFVGSALFLGLRLHESGLISAAPLAKDEVVCCFSSPLMEDADGLSRAVAFSAVADDPAANCRLKPSPFLSKTIMVSATRAIAPGERVLVQARDRLDARPSGIAGAGMGCFARVTLPAGDDLGEYRGRPRSARELADKAAAIGESMRAYALCLGGGAYLDPTDDKGLVWPFSNEWLCFVNRADAPEQRNCHFERRPDGSVHLIIERTIAADEELLASYVGFFET
jgi:hypothetical protein